MAGRVLRLRRDHPRSDAAEPRRLEPAAALDELTAATGGRAYYPATREQADAAVREISDEMRHLYTIGYSPLAQALDGSYRKLRVVAKDPEKLFVTTRAGYRATRALAGDK